MEIRALRNLKLQGEVSNEESISEQMQGTLPAKHETRFSCTKMIIQRKLEETRVVEKAR